MAVALAIVLYPFARVPLGLPGLDVGSPSRGDAGEIVEELLVNVYRSFELREEQAIYDGLSLSVTDDELETIYLDNRRALELENRGGARARVDEVDVLRIDAIRRDAAGGFVVEASWTVSGSVNHFGHVHYRKNRYDAAIELVAVDGIWKIRGIELHDESRLL